MTSDPLIEDHPIATGHLPCRETCGICGRKLKAWATCSVHDPAMDCGGDCWGCVSEAEEFYEPDDDDIEPLLWEGDQA